MWSEDEVNSEGEWFVEESKFEETNNAIEDTVGEEAQSVKKTTVTGKPSGEAPEKEGGTQTSPEKGDNSLNEGIGNGEGVAHCPETQLQGSEKSVKIDEENQIQVKLGSNLPGPVCGPKENSNVGPQSNVHGQLMVEKSTDGLQGNKVAIFTIPVLSPKIKNITYLVIMIRGQKERSVNFIEQRRVRVGG
ncbi:hypothetical protein L6452_16299 [Arctium lappa]|uniref:Uncharacterized protein n=1 Tax=Arctium lappa TaxID=4217 RepID=A0ACB9C045_ARCLA|nr:hypothetical protein L6452_16299 [Arctium lappa]